MGRLVEVEARESERCFDGRVIPMNMRVTLRELRHIIREELNKNYGNYRWYHLSQKDLGPSFTFTPRQPRFPQSGPHGMTIEDDFTERTSWAPNIERAIEALGASIDRTGTLYIYATNKLSGEVDVEENFLDAPASPDNEYGEQFDVMKFMDWAEEEGYPKDMLRAPPESKHSAIRALKGQVPDSPETHEHWATKPVKAKMIGTLHFEAGQPVID